MAKVKLTAGRIAGFKCDESKTQDFLWCSEVPGLGIRATPNSTAKVYIYQSKVKGKTMRITIGKLSVWSIQEAQTEARRLQIMIDNGDDPREVKSDKQAAKEAAKLAKEAEAAALAMQEARESVTVAMAWAEYIAARKPKWSESHYHDHEKDMHPGGAVRSRSTELTKPGTLASLATVRLIDLTPERVEEWAKLEAETRPTRARLSLRLLKAFLFWCARHPAYKAIVTTNAAKSKDARESLGKAKVKDDVLQREQLPAWFAAVKQIGNPVISAYLQCLLLTGSRREELAALRWVDVDFQWNKLTIHDKVEDFRIIPLTPYVAHLLAALPRRNVWVFSSPTAASGHLTEPRIAHNEACAIAGLDMTLHGLRRSFATLSEWTETPAGIAAQIQGHKPQGVREQNYIRRPLDLLRMWHIKIEAWMLEQAGIEFNQSQGVQGLRVVK
ncbi:MAG: integrase arm-type DNA-binding domain-containing protein [Methylovulum sp.]|nr:integrase arm-type DNA-binding domain-containing protein [Methylovulum sp.]